VQAGGVDAMLDRLKTKDARDRIRADIERAGLNNWGRIENWDCIQISITPHLPQYAGRTVAQLAAAWKKDPVDVMCDYLIEDRGATRVLVISISEEDIREVVACPTALVGSDGNCVADYGIVSGGMPHPRFYGTFPRVLGRYVAEQKVVPLETALNKMTGATAKALRLADRGLLKPGYKADVTLFDPLDFKDLATYADPHRYPTGARTTVVINGTLVVENATHTGATPGRVLRRAADGRVA
jgi:N-acyl-D-aspartate/D-glutamate deacylase